jgi:hypothetical protein
VVYRACLETLEPRQLLSFTLAGNHPTIGTPSAIVTADFNNDGNLDLATCADAGEGSFSILLGNGAGGFAAAQRTVVGSQLTSMAVADFNSDGNVDIVAANWSASVLHLMKGNGDGTFQPSVDTPQWQFLERVTVGNFNNDNYPDLLVNLSDFDFFSNIYQVQLGDGQDGFRGSYNDPWIWDVNSPYGVGMAAADVNNDGKLDAVTADVDTFLGDGNGALQEPSYSPVNGAWAVATGDFTGDGKADVISVGVGVLAVLRGRGDGSFDPPVLHTANGTRYAAVATADFNADGKLDAIVTDHDIGTASVMLGNGDGTLRYFGAYATGSLPSGVAVGDFNGDGRPDAAVSNSRWDARTVSVLLNDGDWQTPPAPPPPPPDISISDVTVTEGDTGTQIANFTLTLSKPTPVEAQVDFEFANITAQAGSDFDYSSGFVVFAAGETSRTLMVPVKGDLILEPTETFSVNLSFPTNLRIADAQGIGTIIDNDLYPGVSIGNASRAEGNSGTTAFTFTISLTSARSQESSVRYSTANGSATSTGGTRDFQSTSGTLNFPAGVTSKTVTVSVVGDTRLEPDETFFVNLSQPVGLTIADSQGLGAILNDDSGRGKNWVGPASGGSWSTAANWNPTGVPNADSLVAIDGASVILSGSAYVSELSLRNGAALSVAAGGNRVLRTESLFLDPNSILDLSNNELIIDYTGESPASAVRSLLLSGRNEGAWNGPGLGSSAAVAGVTVLGYAEAADLFASFPANLGTQILDATSIVVRHTLLGDANLDRKVDISDLGILATNWQKSDRTFSGGDFDYDGDVDVNDLGMLATGWQQQLAVPSAPSLAGDVCRTTSSRIIEDLV